MNVFIRPLVPFLLLLIATLPSLGQVAPEEVAPPTGKSKLRAEITPTSDSLRSSLNDTTFLLTDTMRINRDSLLVKKKAADDGLEAPVKYHARDSIRFSVDLKKVYLYGEAQINYQDIELKADYIEIDQETKEVYAVGVADSTGNVSGKPRFKSGEQEFVAQNMRYNFKTEKGRISEVVTQEGDGNLRGTTVKKLESGSYYIRKGGYTTCDAEHPHYIIAANKLKVIPNDKVVSGPAFLMFEGVYTPLVVPFGWFPNKQGRSSGIIFPEYGESPSQGFFFRNMGYYFNLGEKMDLAVTGDIYTQGSYGLKLLSNYNKRYKFRGQVEVTHNSVRNGDPDFPNYSVLNNYFLRWQHTQDPKANPTTSFTANVNAGTATNFTNGLRVNQNDFLTNTFTSAISFEKRFANTPFTLRTNLSHSQNTQTRNVSVSFPDVSFNMNRIFPFARKNAVGKQRWYEKIGLSYAFNARNQISTVDSTFFTMNTLKTMRNGISHSIPISTSFRILKHFTVAPSVTYNERWFFQSVNKGWDNESQQAFTDTTTGFFSNRDVSANVNVTTQIYGLVQFKKGAVKGIRHVFTPQIGYRYAPKISENRWAYAGPNGARASYHPDELSLFGRAPTNSNGAVTINLNNNLEMKVRSKKDTITGFKKIKILEVFNIGTSYNLFADSLNLSDININGRTTLLDRFQVNFNFILSPYAQDTLGRKINRWLVNETGELTRLTNASLQVSFALNAKTRNNDYDSQRGSPEELAMVNAQKGAYVDFNIPWNVNVNYNLSVVRRLQEDEIVQTFGINGDINITPKWKIGFMTGYDFVRNDVANTSLSIYRDLHCWDFSLNWVPFGGNQSWSFDLKVKSAMLQDLKLSRRKDYFDY
jgi:lipopolysaccharide assembly outer membrane protein LptD (OstA)